MKVTMVLDLAVASHRKFLQECIDDENKTWDLGVPAPVLPQYVVSVPAELPAAVSTHSVGVAGVAVENSTPNPDGSHSVSAELANGLPGFLTQPAGVKNNPPVIPPSPDSNSESVSNPVQTESLEKLRKQVNETFAKYYNSNTDEARELAAGFRSRFGIDDRDWSEKDLGIALTELESALRF